MKVLLKSQEAVSRICRGFYQVEEDLLYVPLYPSGKFYSYLDSDQVTLDIDNTGRLLFIQVRTPRHAWNIVDWARPPATSNPADIRFLDFRNTLPPAQLQTSPDQSWLRLVFDTAGPAGPCLVAENLIFEISPESTLAAIWIIGIEDDRAAHGMAAWRKSAGEKAGPSS